MIWFWHELARDAILSSLNESRLERQDKINFHEQTKNKTASKNSQNVSLDIKISIDFALKIAKFQTGQLYLFLETKYTYYSRIERYENKYVKKLQRLNW